MAIPQNTLKKLLVESSLIEEAEFSTLEQEAKRTGVSIDRLLISQGRLTQQYLSELVSKFLNIPIVDFQVTPIQPEALHLLPESAARQRNSIVFDHDAKKGTFQVAMADPTDVDTINFLREYLKGEIEPYIASAQTLRLGYQVYKRKAAKDFEHLLEEKVQQLVVTLQEVSGMNILESVPLTQLFDNIIDYGATLNASDIYFQPEEDKLIIRFRVDGLLRDVTSIDKRVNEGLVARAKILSGLRIDEHMRPQDGRFKFKSSSYDVDIRTAVIPTFYGEKITLRLLPAGKELISFEELGVDHENTGKKLLQEIHKPYGMILSSGPTGSGKTTTIYAILNILNRPEVHITTIEDPVEYVVPRVSQTQVNPAAGITFATGLRSFLRHSPDIMVVGEIRDAETAEIAIHAALTGHLLISTIHTNNAVGAIPRLIDLGVPAFFVSATLNAVIAQRLVRRICQQCIASHELSHAEEKTIQQEMQRHGRKRDVTRILYKGKGCSACGKTGYSGRIGLFELFVIDEKVRNIITSQQVTTDALLEVALAQGMKTMFEDGLEKAEHGLTTLEEIFRAIRE